MQKQKYWKNIYKNKIICYNNNVKKFLLFIIIILSSFFAINYNCKVFANSNSQTDIASLSQLNIINENYIFGVDATNNKIVKKINNQVETFGEYGNLDGQFTEIKFFKVLSNNELVVLDSLNRLQFFDTNFKHLKTIQYVSNSTQLSLIGNITSICCDIYANIYLLDSTNNYIIKANSQSTYAEIFENNIESSIIIININMNGTPILASSSSLLFNNLTQTFEENISEVYVDALNFIYVKTASTIYKFNSSLVQKSSLQLPNSCTNLSINLEEGIFYYLKSDTSEILKIENFASNVSNLTPPFNIEDNNAQSKETKFAQITKDCYLYSTPYQISSDISLTKNCEILILAENFDESLFFTYVMLVKDNKVIVGFIKSDCYSYSNNSYSGNGFLIRKDIPYFKLPLKEYNETSLKLGTLNANETYQITQKVAFNNLEFYEIKLNDKYVFVESKNILQNISNYINVYLKPDSVVKTINNEKSVNIYSTEDKTDVLYLVEKPLNVKTVKKIGSLYEIQFLLDNEIKTGYVESANLFKNKNNFVIPIVIVLVVICLIIILIILFKFKKEFKRNI